MEDIKIEDANTEDFVSESEDFKINEEIKVENYLISAIEVQDGILNFADQKVSQDEVDEKGLQAYDKMELHSQAEEKPLKMPSTATKKIKLSPKGSGRNFQDWWTEEYGVVDKGDKVLCVLCEDLVVSRTWNVKRHFATKHQSFLERTAEDRKEYLSHQLQIKRKRPQSEYLQSENLAKRLPGSSPIVAASFSISHSIVDHGKSLSDGEFIKEAFVKCVPFLFDDFHNKDAIIKRVNELAVSRNTVKDRVMKMNANIETQTQEHLNTCDFFSICLDETTDITSSDRLAIIARYFHGDSIHEELIKLESLHQNASGKDICDCVVKIFREKQIDLSKIVSVSTDGGPKMVDQNVGFVEQLTDAVGHSLVAFHCVMHLEVLCANVRFQDFSDVMGVVVKVVNLIAARTFHKQEFNPLLNEVESVCNGLLMCNNIRWLSRGRILELFVECLNEIRLFLDTKSKDQNFPQLNDVSWLSKLMFFTDLSFHQKELFLKLQGFGKSVDVMFGLIRSFENKLVIFQRDLESRSFKYFPRVKKFFEEARDHNIEQHLTHFIEIIRAVTEQFCSRFVQFKELQKTIQFLRYPDEADFTDLKLDAFEWLNLGDLEMQLVDFQSSPIWKQKFITLRADLEEIERKRLRGIVNKHSDCELLRVWNLIPENFDTLKILAKALLTIFSSTYSCETLFSALNNAKTNNRNRMGDDLTAACVALKCTCYSPPIKQLSYGTQQQKSH